MNRFPLALFLSFLVLFAWMQFMAPPSQSPGAQSPGEGQQAEQLDGLAGNDSAGNPVPMGEQGAGTATGIGSGLGVGTTELAAPPASELADLPGRLVADEESEYICQIDDPVEKGGPVEAGHYWMRFSNRGARLVEMRFLDYVERARLGPEERQLKENWTPLLEPFHGTEGETGSLLLEAGESARAFVPESLSQVLWEMEELPDGARFRYAPGTGVIFEKTIRAVPGTWHLSVSLTIENVGAGALGSAKFQMIPAGVVPPALGDRFYLEPIAVAVGKENRGGFDLEQERAPRAKGEGGPLNAGNAGLVYAGVHNKYFAFLMRDVDGQSTLRSARWDPVVEDVSAFEERKPEKRIETEIQLALDLPEEGQKGTWEWTVYAGPKDPDVFPKDLEAHSEILGKDLGFFASIGRFLLGVLRFFHWIFGNWGVAIIVMTICVRAALFPLNRRSQTSMARYQTKMKRVQPRIDEIKKRFENDPKKLREAQAKIMQEEGAFPPLGGCMPMFVQIPIFFGLFSALRTSWDLRQADFGFWIHDLSLPDRLLVLNMKVPLLVTTLDLTYLNILPPIMVVLWILQQRGMPQPSDAQAKQMQKIMMFMPVLFGVFLYNYAAGLSLYMITQSGLGIVEQRVIKKLWPIDDRELEATKKKSGCGPFAGWMENIAKKHRDEMERMERAKRSGKGAAKKKRKK